MSNLCPGLRATVQYSEDNTTSICLEFRREGVSQLNLDRCRISLCRGSSVQQELELKSGYRPAPRFLPAANNTLRELGTDPQIQPCLERRAILCLRCCRLWRGVTAP